MLVTLYNKVLQIERVQKCALHIILGDKYESYNHATEVLQCERLEDGRDLLCENFVKKAVNSEKYNSWFKIQSNQLNVDTRSSKRRKLRHVPCQTSRYEK